MDFTKDIYINKDTIYEDQEIVILYKGYLFSNNMLKPVYISYGYGNMWDNKSETKMKPSTFGYLATIKVETGENLQFCFRDDEGNWDNNNNSNYILPIHENETILSFKALSDTSKPVSFEPYDQLSDDDDSTDEIFNPSVINSNNVELYKTVDLDNITKQTVPNDTVITKVSLDEKSNTTVASKIIKAEPEKQTVAVAFSELTSRAKEQSAKAFDENNVTAGSVYVNSIIKDIPDTPSNTPKVVKNIDEQSLVVKEPSAVSKVGTFFGAVFGTIKTAFSKVVKLVKTSFQFGSEEDE